VHFVDQINLITAFGRRVAHVVAQLAHVFDAVIARAIDLDDIKAVAGGDLFAIVAHSAWRHRRSVHAIECLGQNARGRCFADAARPDKEISVGETVLRDRVLQRLRDMVLANEIVEGLGSILSCEDLVAHSFNLNALLDRRK
jgi:hypothetical protein